MKERKWIHFTEIVCRNTVREIDSCEYTRYIYKRTTFIVPHQIHMCEQLKWKCIKYSLLLRALPKMANRFSFLLGKIAYVHLFTIHECASIALIFTLHFSSSALPLCLNVDALLSSCPYQISLSFVRPHALFNHCYFLTLFEICCKCNANFLNIFVFVFC